MNYEEKYNEILEWARKNKARLNGVPIEEVLPELAESEDERIRKMCIAAVNIAASADGGLLYSEASECLAWLEEQKDKNCLACDQHLKGYIAGRKVTEEEKQKEQKPAEWSEEDEKYLNRVINLWVNDFDEDSDTVKWLKSLRPSWKPSEEQMKALQNAVALTACDKELARLYNQLQKL